jgi:hypothetical protein
VQMFRRVERALVAGRGLHAKVGIHRLLPTALRVIGDGEDSAPVS